MFEAEKYRQDLVKAAPALAEPFDALVQDGARYMSARGMADWLGGARALAGLGRGAAPVEAWMNDTPQVVRECGEDVLRDIVEALLKLASMVSGEVIALAITTLPVAARRLADPDLLRGWLRLLHRIAARAPRGLRPMLGVLDELMARLTLSGLRRWADFGAEAYRIDFARQAAYFGLQSEDSRAVFQAERSGTLFVDVQRRINFYLRAFWGRDFFLRPASADRANFRAFADAAALHLPDAVEDWGDVPGLELYRATAAHLAAHLVYTDAPQTGETAFSPAQRFLIGMVEDARVEHCAAAEFPGMAVLWARIMQTRPDTDPEHPGLAVIERVAHALLDPAVIVGHEALDLLVDDIRVEFAARPRDAATAARLGLALHDILAANHLLPSLRILEGLRVPYRDDNRLIWAEDPAEWVERLTGVAPAPEQVRKHVSLMEFVNEVEVETAGDDAQEIWVLGSELFPYEDEGISYNEKEGKPPIVGPFHYDEWDMRVQLHRPSWTSVYEHRAGRGDPEVIDRVKTEHRGVTHRIRQIVDRLRPQGLTRERRLEDGDVLDIGAAVDAMVMLRAGFSPDPRITMRYRLNRRDLAAMILLDLSESTNDPVRGADTTVLELTRQAAALVGLAIDGIGDPFAIHGFASNGRHDVRYTRFKDFEQPFDGEVKSRLAGMKGGLSTRMGAALRHGAAHLRARGEKHKLMLLVTDGEPADIDERDPGHLREDTRKAVEELARAGIRTYCLTLDPHADVYVSRIFGKTGYTVIDNVARLPEKLPALFASLTR